MGEQCKLTLIFSGKDGYPSICQRCHQEQTGTNKQQNFAVGGLVIVRNINTPKSHWPLARIVAIYPGDDGIIWTVKIRTSNGEFVRPSQLLLLLELLKQ